jgi:aspartyl/asparaginyl-tRNA synthetase
MEKKSFYEPEFTISVFRVKLLTYIADNAGSKMVFFELRQQTDTIQALLVQSTEVSKQMYKFAASINPESIVLVKGTVKKSTVEIMATTIKDTEIHISQVSGPLLVS